MIVKFLDNVIALDHIVRIVNINGIWYLTMQGCAQFPITQEQYEKIMETLKEWTTIKDLYA